MNLRNYYEKEVEILSVDGNFFRGRINDYFEPDDNENNLESIVMDTIDGDIIEFYEHDIETITII